MSLQALLDASWAIQLHVYTLVLAFVAGTAQLFGTRRGSPVHVILGRCFLVLMLVSALVTLLIHVRNPRNPLFGLSLLHLYVPLVVGLCTLAWLGAIRHRLRLHRFAVISLYFGSLVFTGYVQIFLVNGITHQIFFGTREVRRVVRWNQAPGGLAADSIALAISLDASSNLGDSVSRTQ
jgi:uncharacterized membrane protein